jgi:ATP-dependent helicase HrpA
LSYHFDPSTPNDGATLSVPTALAEMLDPGELDWGIEGWRGEKIIAIIRGLPKAQRRDLVPATAVAERALRALEPLRSLPFYEALSRALYQAANVHIPANDLAAVPLAPYLRLHLTLIDGEGRVIVSSRDAGDLRRAVRAADTVPNLQAPSRRHSFERDRLRTWDFDELPERLLLEQQGVELQMYPAVVDRGDGAALVLLPDAERARAVSRGGVLRLLSLALASTVRGLTREISAERDLMLLHHLVGPTKDLSTDIVECALLRVSFSADSAVPRTRAQFEAARERAMAGLAGATRELSALVQSTLALNLQITRALVGLSPALDAQLVADLQRARARLVYPGFVAATPDPWLD